MPVGFLGRFKLVSSLFGASSLGPLPSLALALARHSLPTSPIVQNLELRPVEDFPGQLELIFKWREERVALNDALHQGEVQV